MIRILLPQRWSTSSSVECSSDLFAKPRSLKKEWCGFMDDVFFHQSLAAFVVFYLQMLMSQKYGQISFWVLMSMIMIWGAGSNWNSIQIDTSIHLPFVNDVWIIWEENFSHWWMDGGFYAFFWLLQWKEWLLQFIQFQLPGPTASPDKITYWCFAIWKLLNDQLLMQFRKLIFPSSSEFFLVDLLGSCKSNTSSKIHFQ